MSAATPAAIPAATLAPTLHYLHDPLCGWCYGAAPLIRIARGILPVQAHAGGMMAGPRRTALTPALSEHVRSHDQRIARLTGQSFGSAYTEGLLRQPGVVFDSGPPITAVLAAGQIAGREFDMLARVQTAHYVDGLRIAEPAVLVALAGELGLDEAAFRGAFDALTGAPTEAHIAKSLALLARLGGEGFPTLAIERGGRFERLDAGAYHGRLPAWEALLREQLADSPASAGDGAEAASCSIDGCGP